MSQDAVDRRNFAGPIIAVTVVPSLLYTVLRYHIFGSVPWKDFPLFILNKGISLSAFVLLCLNFGLGPLNNPGAKVPATWLGAPVFHGIQGLAGAFGLAWRDAADQPGFVRVFCGRVWNQPVGQEVIEQ